MVYISWPDTPLIHNFSIKRFYWAGPESRRVFSCHGSMSSECQPVSLNWQFRVVKWVFNKWGMQQRSITLILIKWSEIDILTIAAWERAGDEAGWETVCWGRSANVTCHSPCHASHITTLMWNNILISPDYPICWNIITIHPGQY